MCTAHHERATFRHAPKRWAVSVGRVTTAGSIAQLGALLADRTRSEILCALMDGRAHTGSELARHIGVAPSTISEHLSKLLDSHMVAVEAQGRHRYYRLSGPEVAELLETLGANPTSPPTANAPADLRYARTCYDHLAGELAVAIYDHLLLGGFLADADRHITITPNGFAFLSSIGVDIDAITGSTRPQAKQCLDWTQRRHHLAGAAGKELLTAFKTNGWVRPGNRPRSIRLSETGRSEIARNFNLA